MQAVFSAESSSPMHQCGKHSLFVGWLVMAPNVEVQICMGGFAVHSVAQRAFRSTVNICVQEWEVALLFGLHGELNALMHAV
jgi:hypothetical protein